MTEKTISLILLCYNDGESLKHLIPDCIQILSSEFSDFEIIVVDDGSEKETLDILQSFHSFHPKLKIVRHESNQGVGVTFQTGVLHSCLELIAYMDGDSQYSPSDLPLLVEEMAENSVVSGLRVKRADSFKRKLISKIFNQTIQNIYHLKLKDINSGIKIYPAKELKQILPLISSGPFFDSEVLIRLKQIGINAIEIPVKHYCRKYGQAGGISKKSIKTATSEIVDVHFINFRSKNLKTKLSVAFVKFLVNLS